MSAALTVRKYAAFTRIAAMQARRERGELYGRVVFFAVILGVFSSLWQATREAGVVLTGDPRTLVWYLASTEWILLSVPMVHVDIQEAVRRGDVVYLLGRPVSYVGAAFAEALGQLLMRAPMLAATAFVCAFAFTGWVPPLRAVGAVAGFGLVASALDLAEIVVRAGRPDDAAGALSGVDAAGRRPDPVSGDSRLAGVVHAGRRRGRAPVPRHTAGDLGHPDHGDGALDLYAGDDRVDVERRVAF
jgi:hypothetical protein